MNKKILITACLLGFIGVAIGAFAAHGLKNLITEASLKSFETGVRYQMYHAFLLLFLGTTNFVTTKIKRYVYGLVVGGVALFSFSIYALATNSLTVFNFKTIGFITPIGGVLLLTAWAILIVCFIRQKQ